MIKLEVQPYCSDCLDFEASVKEPQITRGNGGDTQTYSDTIIRCRHARRCESLMRYLRKQIKEEEV